MRKGVIWVSTCVFLGLSILGCDSGQQTNTVQPVTIPQQPVGQIPGAVGVPTAVPTVPGAVGVPTAVPTVPGAVGVPTAVPAVPGAVGVPTAVPTVPTAQVQAIAPTPTGDALTDKLNAKKYEVAPQAQPTSALLKQALSKGKSQSYQVQLSGPPYCQTYVASAGDAVKNIDLVLESPTGTKEASDGVEGSVAVIANHCPTIPGIYKLTVSMPSDEGEFAVQVFSK